MANTPPRPPIHERSSEELLEDLCLQLRSVACGEGHLPLSKHVVACIRVACAIHAELVQRHVEFLPRLERLSEETRWQIPPLLEDCLAYPTRVPYVRESDGVRRFLRCHLCRKSERPADSQLFWFCDACMHNVLHAVQQRIPVPGIVLFRTYNVDCRCIHADSDTVVAIEGQLYVDEVRGVCEECIYAEIERRRAANPAGEHS